MRLLFNCTWFPPRLSFPRDQLNNRNNLARDRDISGGGRTASKEAVTFPRPWPLCLSSLAELVSSGPYGCHLHIHWPRVGARHRVNGRPPAWRAWPHNCERSEHFFIDSPKGEPLTGTCQPKTVRASLSTTARSHPPSSRRRGEIQECM